MELDAPKYPRGFAKTDLPFYTRMDDSAFEQFCTDLLNEHPVLHCRRDSGDATRKILSAIRIGSGTLQKGADIRAEAEQGEVWFFQCKHTQAFTPGDVKTAIALAERSLPYADQFVMITTARLSLEAIEILAKHPKWLFWDSSSLTCMTHQLGPRESAISLVQRYFGLPQAKAFFPCGNQPLQTWQEFFARDLSSAGRGFHHDIPLFAHGEVLGRLESFAHTGAGKALVLSASGGQGKSRLLLELARTMEDNYAGIRVRFLNLTGQSGEPDQMDFLTREKEALLLIVDDAHRMDAAIQDIARATVEAKTVRLLFATRPQALDPILSQLHQSSYTEEKLLDPIRLPRWKPEEIQELAEHLLGPQLEIQTPRLAALADRCPLLVVLGAAQMKSGSWAGGLPGQTEFQLRVFQSFQAEFLNCQLESSRERMKRLIQLLSFISPTPDSENFRDKASALLGCSVLELADDMDRLQSAGLLAENREGIRLYPDLFADAVLLDATIDRKGKPSTFCREVLKILPSGDFPALLKNLAQADWTLRVRRGESTQLFEPIWEEFVRRFESSEWPNPHQNLTEQVLERLANPAQLPDRVEILRQWEPLAVYLPDKTIQLAQLAIELTQTPFSSSASDGHHNAFCLLSKALTPLLHKVLITHAKFANPALELLWSLEANETPARNSNHFNPITAIADAASFNILRPLTLSASVLSWLEDILKLPRTKARIRGQPWILSALLKPFFGRAVEHTWASGQTFHSQTLPVSPSKTRSLRQKAMGIAKLLIASGDGELCAALIPAVETAVTVNLHRSAPDATPDNSNEWTQDRVEAAGLLESITKSFPDCPAILLQCHRILRKRSFYDPDTVVRETCEQALRQIPDTFEMRVARLLSLSPHDEFPIRNAKDFPAKRLEAERQWSEFRQLVAHEATRRFPKPDLIAEFLKEQVVALKNVSNYFHAGIFLDEIAQISSEWCNSLLDQLLNSDDPTMDIFTLPILNRACVTAQHAYQRALEWLPARGRATQMSALIDHLGWKHLHGGGLTIRERLAVLQIAARGEPAIIASMASVCGLHFANRPKWAMRVLKRLRPSGENDSSNVLEALGHLTATHPTKVQAADVRECLANIGRHFGREMGFGEDHFGKIARFFPREVYEHLRSLLERGAAGPTQGNLFGFVNGVQLGPIRNQPFVESEIQSLWSKCTSSGTGWFAEENRLALLRCLLRSEDIQFGDQIGTLISKCRDGRELHTAAKLVGCPGSRFVFEYPALVRKFLAKTVDRQSADLVERRLWFSACGGDRSYTEHAMDPEYRYILEQAMDLANRHADDALLSRFYRSIANAEREATALNQKLFALDDAD